MSMSIVFLVISGILLFIGFPDIVRSLPKRHIITNVVMCTVGFCFLYLGMLTFTEKNTPPNTFVQANTAVLATVKEGDLILCTDPETNQVKYALLVESSAPQGSKVILHGNFLNRQSLFQTNGGIYTSYFDKCRVEAFRDDGLGSIDQKIGKIIRSGLNPPSPPK